MEEETAARRARPRLNPFTKAERRQRIFGRLRVGWTYEKIALEEGLSERRIRQIVTDAVRREELDDPTNHALLQLMRLEGAQAVAAQAVDSGDLAAIGPYLKVLERIDRYQKAGARKAVYDAAARKALFAKLNRIAAQLEAGKSAVAAGPASPPRDPLSPEEGRETESGSRECS